MNRKTGDILLVWLTPKSETKAERGSESWQATEKPESKARHMGWRVGGQQKNQSIREMHNATAL